MIEIIFHILYLLIGFYLLIKGANLVVDHASALALKAGIPMFIVGLTLIAFGTSLPELSVSLTSAVQAFRNGVSADIAVGNIVGSNIANLTLIFGSSALIAPVVIHKRILKQDIPFLIFISFLFVVFMYFFDETYTINRIESALLLLCFVMYLYMMIKQKVSEPVQVHNTTVIWKALVLLGVGFVGVILGGNIVTSRAEILSSLLLVDVFQMNPLKVTSLVGLSVVAVGTSLPELITTIVAVKKGSFDIAVGNVIGSNIFNILLVGGLSGLIAPLLIQSDMIIDSIVILSITFILFIFMRLKFKMHKMIGYGLLLSYAVYIIWIIIRTI